MGKTVKFLSNDGSRYRNERARKATSIAIEIAGLTLEQAGMFIYSVTDYKGRLEIVWKVRPSARQKDAFEAAWFTCNEQFVEHTVADDWDDGIHESV